MEKKTKLKREFLETVLKLYYKDGLSEQQIAHRLSIGHTTVSRWVAEYAQDNNSDRQTLRTQMGGKRDELLQIRDDVHGKMLKNLQKKLDTARHQVAMLEGMIASFLQREKGLHEKNKKLQD